MENFSTENTCSVRKWTEQLVKNHVKSNLHLLIYYFYFFKNKFLSQNFTKLTGRAMQPIASTRHEVHIAQCAKYLTFSFVFIPSHPSYKHTRNKPSENSNKVILRLTAATRWRHSKYTLAIDVNSIKFRRRHGTRRILWVSCKDGLKVEEAINSPRDRKRDERRNLNWYLVYLHSCRYEASD